MAKQRIYFDKQEVVVQYNDGKFMTDKVLHADKVASVTFYIKKKGIFRTPVKTITVRASGIPELEYSQKRAKQHFEGYITGFRKYCKENRVTLYDNFKEKEDNL